MNKIKSICVFCGSSSGIDQQYLLQAQRLGKYLAETGVRLVFGGSNIGLMGALAGAVMENGGYAIGVIPRRIYEMGAQGSYSEEYIVESMHERKAKMYALSDAFVMLPGGIGTMEEFFEVFTWNQLGYQLKPIGILEINGFFSPLQELLRHLVSHGFLRREHLDTLVVAEDCATLLSQLAHTELHYIKKIG